MIAGIVACADVGGFYQKLHQTPPVESLAGAYMLSVESRFAAVSPIVLAGSANGSAFHTVDLGPLFSSVAPEAPSVAVD